MTASIDGVVAYGECCHRLPKMREGCRQTAQDAMVKNLTQVESERHCANQLD